MAKRFPTALSVAGLTRAGRVRTLNEDCFCLSEIGGALRRGPEDVVERLSSDAGFVLGVYDGAGGNGAGDAASATAARVVSGALATVGARQSAAEVLLHLVEAVTAAGAAILAESRADPNRRGMGSTATAMAVCGEDVVVAHVGDSRAYLLRGRELTQQTRDDTLLEEALRTGSLSPAQAGTFPHKNVLLQVLGTGGDLKVGSAYLEARHGDVLLLCTDGIHGLLDHAVIRALLLRHRDPGVAARVLVDEAMRAGGTDNVAVIVARIDGLLPPDGEDGPTLTRAEPRRG